jgi:hypothetical protein
MNTSGVSKQKYFIKADHTGADRQRRTDYRFAATAAFEQIHDFKSDVILEIEQCLKRSIIVCNRSVGNRRDKRTNEFFVSFLYTDPQSKAATIKWNIYFLLPLIFFVKWTLRIRNFNISLSVLINSFFANWFSKWKISHFAEFQTVFSPLETQPFNLSSYRVKIETMMMI